MPEPFTARIVIEIAGRLDARRSVELEKVLDAVSGSAIVDCSKLTYISSSALGVLFAAQKRLLDQQHSLTLTCLSAHIREVFSIGRFDTVFKIEERE